MGSKKNFVLDTNVILHDYNCLKNFQENDIYLPIVVLEELDKFKKGNEQINYNAREFVRELDLLTDDNAREHVMESVDRRLTLAPWASVLRISALTGRSIEKIWALADAAAAARSARVSTSSLNRLLTEMREFGHTVVDGKRRLRMHYATQTGTEPPTFTFFVNHTDLVSDSYRRYIENRMREAFGFAGTPIRLRFRKKDTRDAKGEK